MNGPPCMYSFSATADLFFRSLFRVPCSTIFSLTAPRCRALLHC
jgi:hypothetical protein